MSFAMDDIGLKNLSPALQTNTSKTRIVKESSDKAETSNVEDLENPEKITFSENLDKRLSGTQDSLDRSQEGGTMLTITSNSLSSISDTISEIKTQIKSVLDNNASNEDLKELSDSIEKKLAEIDKVVEDTTFNGKKLLDGSVQDSLQIDDGNGGKVNISTEFKDTSLKALGLPESENFSISSKEDAQSLLEKLDTTEKEIGTRQAKISGYQNVIQKGLKDLFLTEINLLEEDDNSSITGQIKNNVINGVLNNPDGSVKIQIKSLNEDVLLALIRLHM
jgi:flagellin